MARSENGPTGKSASLFERENLDDQYTHVERCEILAAVLKELPAKLRVIFVLCDIEGFRLKEVAAKLGVSESAVKTRRCRASRLLRERVKEVRSLAKFSAQLK